MKFSIGYQLTKTTDFLKTIISNKESVSEVYFAWDGFANGRNTTYIADDFTQWGAAQRKMSDLRALSENGIKLNLLFNATCYGADSLSKAFFERLGDTTDFVKSAFGLSSITTTSPIIGKFIKANFPDLEVRASVNMEIGTIEGMRYIAEYFDSFYMKRELNRDFDAIKKLYTWCKENGKTLCMLANSGCLNFCSAHNFHDNLVSHESEISKMNNAYDFRGICKEFLQKHENLTSLIDNTNFIRPEDIYKYEPYFETVKLATRVNPSPIRVIESYIKGKYSGNILELLEPAHNIYPYIIENGDPLKLKKIETDITFLE
ncbi:MAG: hypothetical protein J5590_04830 [Clostridia bacterium]|nr:hypothetical protein [Clostridia bacterium]